MGNPIIAKCLAFESEYLHVTRYDYDNFYAALNELIKFRKNLKITRVYFILKDGTEVDSIL